LIATTREFGVIRVHHVEPENRYNFRLVGSKRNLLSLRIDHQSSHERRLLLRIIARLKAQETLESIRSQDPITAGHAQNAPRTELP
jgi:hypothetical protein